MKRVVDFMAVFQGKIDNILEGTPLSFLEMNSVSKQSLEQYLHMLGMFSAWTPISQNTLRDQEKMDQLLVDWVNAEFIKAHRPWKGAKALAALMALVPAYGKGGPLSLPRVD